MLEIESEYTITDLLYVMSRLRDAESGCPWDLKQTFQSIAPHTVEEAYEVVDAIETENYPELKGELGDLLFQVVFYSQLGTENELFSFEDVVSGIVGKLIRRHPHVFPEGTLKSKRDKGVLTDELQIGKTWETIKQSERRDKGHRGVLDDIPASLPALARSAKLQKRAAIHGFDWPSTDGVFLKIQEELLELQKAIDERKPESIEDELGDVFFSVVNLSRHLKLDSETALRKASRKFEQRFSRMIALAERDGLAFDRLSSEEMEEYWNKAKQ